MTARLPASLLALLPLAMPLGCVDEPAAQSDTTAVLSDTATAPSDTATAPSDTATALSDTAAPGDTTARDSGDRDAPADSVSPSDTIAPGETVTSLVVELVWKTPGAPDGADRGAGQGADLDLHFAHPFATGPDLDHDGEPDPWFDAAFDADWSNPRPNWGSFSTVDDPLFVRDDRDGDGPETLSFDMPELARCYDVGVHAFTDNGSGPSDATVRVYSWGTPIYEATAQLATRDFWAVGSVCAGSERFLPTRVCTDTLRACALDADCDSGATCGPHIATHYPNSATKAP